MKYILDTSILQPCDIILTRQNKPISKTIRYFSDSDYSHALTCLSNSSLIEATLKGRVFTENPERLIFNEKEECKVLRLKSELSIENVKIIIHFLRNQIGTMYSVKEALLTIKLSETDALPKDQTQFCSRLVAQAYKEANIFLVSNPNYCTPEALNSSDLLETVSDAVRIATNEEISFAKQPSQIKENQKQTYIWLDAATELAKQEKFKIITQGDVGKFLIQYRKYDHDICKSIKSTNYLQQYKLDELVNSSRYIFNSHAQVNFDREYKVNFEIIERHSINYFNSIKNSQDFKLEYFSLLEKMYKNLLIQAIQRLTTLENYLVRDMHLHKNKIESLMSLYQKVETLKDKTIRIIS
ncbi:hypothetical protein MWMV17_MWMV17_03404 [Acinetobacter calcoaceticus]|uniref:PIN domain-containing protein n=1 Tax=Acinetobacter calcoaceticus DSM 30006 = CIP 81.8 TaxID=981331 RepID=A0ABP2UBY0_ACICA|nr:YiiX/YebB-like N1pC/P60 family cysteine hydrolase [Acinetobacter calcoaceticus]ENV97554.1 hypothetical protein F936_03194 [Acinetobacter calcoaceticus DSM 30006 = CIP 81.8]CAI3162276.1 hypothetical protein MWMV17_MWMV17_03404 [Acinetobacter calcoaceticus]SUU52138.1 Orthopoxvirus protein of uncharacterised function (DUF830) [Acinetobacter calcoaceticus]